MSDLKSGSSHMRLIFKVKKGQLSKLLLLNRPIIMAIYSRNLYRISGWPFWRSDSIATLGSALWCSICPLRMPSMLSICCIDHYSDLIRKSKKITLQALRWAYKVAVMVYAVLWTHVRQVPAKFRVKKGSQTVFIYNSLWAYLFILSCQLNSNLIEFLFSIICTRFPPLILLSFSIRIPSERYLITFLITFWRLSLANPVKSQCH